MKLKLKENPREWQKFTTVMMVMVGALSTLAWRRGFLAREVWLGLIAAAVAVAVTAWIYPAPFRKFYRGGMTVSFHMGQVMSRVLLTLFFFLILTPLGLILRILGKDLLGLRRPAQATTYWHPAKTSNSFDRQF